MHLSLLSTWRYTHTMAWALLLSLLIVAIAATIGRATVNLRGALSAEDASLAAMMLIPDIYGAEVVKAGAETQEILAESPTGPRLIRMKRGETQWFVEEEVSLRE